MLDERDVTRKWRMLFRGKAVTSDLLTEAELLTSELPSECPLRLRFATEIDELRKMYLPSRSKGKD